MVTISGIFEGKPIRKRYLRLIEGETPRLVFLSVVDETGHPVPGGNLIAFYPATQTFKLCERVSHDIGLELDSADRIVMHG